jgi:hypothetical protein
MDRQGAERRLVEIASPVAEALGYELVGRDDTHVAEMLSPEGFRVYLNPGWQGGYDKLSISVDWPRDDNGQQVMSSYDARTPRINVSMSRRPGEIAKEIERRLLPDWLPMWEEAQRRIASSRRKHEGDTKSNAVRLAEIVGVDASEVDRNGRFSLYRSEIFPESISDVKVSGDSVTLELHTYVAGAEEILKALVRLAKK